MQDKKQNETENTDAQQPVEPMDLALAWFDKWLAKTETALDEARKETELPGDIPRFYTRYP